MTSDLNEQNSSALRNRVALEDSSIQKVDRWLDQVHREARGVRIKRTQLLDWLILSLPETMKPRQIKRISKQFYDAVVDMEVRLQEAKAARARGEPIPATKTKKSSPSERNGASKVISKPDSEVLSQNENPSEIVPKSDEKKSAKSSIS